MIVNGYMTRAEFKARLYPAGITDTTDDTIIDAVLESVSRLIDIWTGRHFFPKTETRYYTGEFGEVLRVDDLLSVTTLKSDDDGDRVYEDTWAATDYDLEPFNAPNEPIPQPYTQIRISPNGNYMFPTIRKGIEITGMWGFNRKKDLSTATLNGALNTSQTNVVVTDGTPFGVGHLILIDNEQMRVDLIATNTLTVTRSVNGTTAATHSNGASIYVYTFPIIKEICLLQAARLFKRKDAPFGVVAAPEVGELRLLQDLDPDVKTMLQPFRRFSIRAA